MDVDARVEALEAENQRLRDQVTALQDALGQTEAFRTPAEWRLTASEATVFASLYGRESCSKEQLMHALYEPGVDDEPNIKIVDVFICKLRKKLTPYGVAIETIWGRGYRMTAQTKARVQALIAADRGDDGQMARAS